MTTIVSRAGTLLLLFLCHITRTAQALSNGAAGCEGGKAAVNGLHMAQDTVLTGPLIQDDIEFQINGVALQSGVPFEIEIGQEYNWKLITAGTYFRGFLIRLGRGEGNVDTRDALDITGYTGKIADDTCVSAWLVGGVTHNSNVLKNVEQGTLTIDLPSQNMELDVTVVIQNRNGYSIYYYSQFMIHANPPASLPEPVGTNNSLSSEATTPTYTPYYPPPTAEPSKTSPPVPATAAPVTAAPVPITPAPVPATAAPVTITPAPVPVTSVPVVTPAPITATPTTAAPVPTTPAPVPVTAAPVPATTAPVAELPTQPPTVHYLFLRYPTCAADAPCKVCQGDCDTDDDCSGSLECFHRPQDDTSPIPGCVGAGVAGRDYCYSPLPNSLRPRIPECTTDNPCDACYGDCDDDSQCMPGLTCGVRGVGELTPIFGCAGMGIAGLDYCYNASAFDAAADWVFGDREDEAGDSAMTISTFVPDSSVPSPPPATSPTYGTVVPVPANAPTVATSPVAESQDDFSSNDQVELTDSETECTPESPCSKCFGDCDEDDDNCEGDLKCFVRPNKDNSIVPGCPGTGTAGADYCWRPIPNTLSIPTTNCDKRSPCQKCQGGCKKDDDCASGLSCFKRDNMSVVPGCSMNGFPGVNFCYDPSDFNGRHMLRH